jgi:EAL domain-containing protein (putative c-di-GMP-specific phosphodiesterase class I)
MTIIAEGVETAEQHDQLSELGCDYCQGSYSPGQCRPKLLTH